MESVNVWLERILRHSGASVVWVLVLLEHMELGSFLPLADGTFHQQLIRQNLQKKQANEFRILSELRSGFILKSFIADFV